MHFYLICDLRNWMYWISGLFSLIVMILCHSDIGVHDLLVYLFAMASFRHDRTLKYAPCHSCRIFSYSLHYWHIITTTSVRVQTSNNSLKEFPNKQLWKEKLIIEYFLKNALFSTCPHCWKLNFEKIDVFLLLISPELHHPVHDLGRWTEHFLQDTVGPAECAGALTYLPVTRTL